MIAIEEICFPLGAPPELTRAAEEITQAIAATSEACAAIAAEYEQGMAQIAKTWEGIVAVQEHERAMAQITQSREATIAAEELRQSVAAITQQWEGFDQVMASFSEHTKAAAQAFSDLVFDAAQFDILRPKPLVLDPPRLRDNSPVRVSRPVRGFQR